MRKIIFWAFFIGSCFKSYSQDLIFSIDSIPKAGILLDRGWKFHTGDNPAWAKPGFDDSQWVSVDPTKDVMNIKEFGEEKMGWFRLTFKIDSSLFGKTFALSVRQVGSSQLFNNGEQLAQIGKFSTSTEKSNAYDPAGITYLFAFTNMAEQTIAVKFEKPDLFLLKNFAYDNNALVLHLLDTQNENEVGGKFIRRNFILFALDYFKSGFFLVIAFLHLWLFLADRTHKQNLYFSFLSFGITITYLLSNYSFLAIDISVRNKIAVVSGLGSPILSLIHCYAYYKTFSLRADSYLVCLAVFTLISNVFLFVNYDFGWLPGLMLGPSLGSLLVFKITWQAYRKGDKVAKVMALSQLTYIAISPIVFIFSDRLFYVQSIVSIKSYIFHVGFLLPSLALVYYFAFHFNRNSRNLKAKLIEVQKLSLEKQEALQKQNAELQTALLKGQTIERQRVALDLHDNLGSTLSALWMSVETVDQTKMNEEEKAIHQNLRENLEKAYNDVRLLSHNLLPEEFEKQGLVTTLQGFARKVSKSSGIRFDLKVDKDFGRVENRIEFELYSICLELVNNILKHSKATEAKIGLSNTGEEIKLIISDNGIGTFENDSDGKGMKNVRARVESLNGTWELEPEESRGTNSIIIIPV